MHTCIVACSQTRRGECRVLCPDGMQCCGVGAHEGPRTAGGGGGGCSAALRLDCLHRVLCGVCRKRGGAGCRMADACREQCPCTANPGHGHAVPRVVMATPSSPGPTPLRRGGVGWGGWGRVGGTGGGGQPSGPTCPWGWDGWRAPPRCLRHTWARLRSRQAGSAGPLYPLRPPRYVAPAAFTSPADPRGRHTPTHSRTHTLGAKGEALTTLLPPVPSSFPCAAPRPLLCAAMPVTHRCKQADKRLMLLVEDMVKHESLPARWISKYDPGQKKW